MKKLQILTAALMVVFLTSMMLVEKNDDQAVASSNIDDTKAIFIKGMITIKVKAGINDLGQQKGNILFNISSLDLKAKKFKVDLLEKRFKYNPEKMKKGMPDLSRIYRIEFPEEISVTKVAREFNEDPNIEYAEPISVIQLLEVPNDVRYDELHHLQTIAAESAWDIHKGENGTEEVVIAIVDSGVEWEHEDLVDNVWQNMGEDLDGDGKTIEFIGGQWIFDPDDENGVDDDGNGYVDDFIGWNFFLSSNDPNPTLGTPNWSHGTHCAGLAAATTNNGIGVASISWNLKMMPIQGGFYNEDMRAYDAIIYAAENGADIISNSWGYYVYSQANHEAISYVNGLGSILVAGACNDQQIRNFYPASYPEVISVSASNHLDQKASYSNFGPQVSISAPGGDAGNLLLSTLPNNSYGGMMGCSMATPVTAGLLGLVKSYNPSWTSEQVITQVLGTADDIDYNNPGYENLLGAGRINAFRALDESGVTLQQEIALDLFYSDFQDFDSNQIPGPGDTISLSLKLRNYNFGVSSENATFTLTTDDPDITIINDTYTADIPADDYFTLEDAFVFVISVAANTHLVNFQLLTIADKEITWGDSISIDFLIAPSGILVYQGEGLGDTYSGDYINEFFINQGYNDVFYTSYFPSSLNGFDAAFLSFGNYGSVVNLLLEGTPITLEMTQCIADYLYQGGRIYIECGSHFGIMDYFEYPNREEMMELFGVDDAEKPMTSNNITLLSGLPASICDQLIFEGSTQSTSWFIDKMTPNDNGIAAFEEDDYGTVAVQGEGDYGQRTFCFAYALAHLEDGSQGTREELMTRIVDFLLLGVGVEDIVQEKEQLEINIFPCPFNNNTTIHFTLDETCKTKIKIIDIAGNQVSSLYDKNLQAGNHEFVLFGENLAPGLYFCCVRSGDHVVVKKIIKH